MDLLDERAKLGTKDLRSLIGLAHLLAKDLACFLCLFAKLFQHAHEHVSAADHDGGLLLRRCRLLPYLRRSLPFRGLGRLLDGSRGRDK
jgi:hypothetical protein